MQIQLLESGRTELAMREEKLQHQLPEQKRVWQRPRDPGGSLSGGDPYLRREAVVEVGIIFKIGAVGILVSVLSLVLKHSGREDQAFLTSLAGLVLVLFWVLPIFMIFLKP